jgi:hypothetical protein
MLDTYSSRPGWLDSLLTATAQALLRVGLGATFLTYAALGRAWRPGCSSTVSIR